MLVRSGSQRHLLLTAYGDGTPLTADEAMRRAGVNERSCYWKRISELVEIGLLADTGTVRTGEQGSAQRVNVITDPIYADRCSPVSFAGPKRVRPPKRCRSAAFGGTRGTGNGMREAGQAGLNSFTEWKSVYIDYSGRLQRAQIDTDAILSENEI